MSTETTLWQRCEALGPQIHDQVVLKMIAKRWIIEIDDHPICYIYHADTGRKMTGPSWVADIIIQRFEARSAIKVIDPSECAHPGVYRGEHCNVCGIVVGVVPMDQRESKPLTNRDPDMHMRLSALWQKMHAKELPSGLHVVTTGINNSMATLMKTGGFAICDLHSHMVRDLNEGYTLQIWDYGYRLEQIEALFVEQPKQTIAISAWEAQVSDMKQRYPNSDIIARMDGNILRAVSVSGRSGLLCDSFSESTITIQQLPTGNGHEPTCGFIPEIKQPQAPLSPDEQAEMQKALDEVNEKPYQVAFIAEAPTQQIGLSQDQVTAVVDSMSTVMQVIQNSMALCQSMLAPKSLDESDAPTKLQP